MAGTSTDTLLMQPVDVEMDRSEVGSNPAVIKQESLKDKLRAHYQKGMKKHRARKLTNPLTPEIINRVAVPFFLFTVFASYKIGFVDVMPLMYEDYDQVIFLQRCFISLIFLEMMVNWLGIRYVDSTYIRYLRLHGPPLHQTSARMTDRTHSSACQINNPRNSSTTLISPSSEFLKPGEFGDSHSSSGKTSPENGGTNIVPTGEIIRPDSASLKHEVDIANEEMERRNHQVNTKSIDDLLNPAHKIDSVSSLDLQTGNSAPPSLLFYSQSDSENVSKADGSVGDPKDKMAMENPSSSLTSPTPVITTQGNVITKAYPYWSWVPCYTCGRARPPRCHHCPLCKTCVLKRDHHCFFAGSCVGYRNHRFFLIFLIWAWTGSMYATLHGFPYIRFFLWEEMTYMDVFFPLAIARFLFGYTQFQAALSVTTLTFLMYFDVLAGTFILDHARLISNGITSFERMFLRKSLEIRDTRTMGKKMRSVFGPYFSISFFLPVHFLTEPQEDPVMWPDIQVFKR